VAKKNISYGQNSFDISYEILNPNAKSDIVILHGWGSNKNIMKNLFGSYMGDFRHIYIDLPGFGNSTCKAVLKTDDYAKIIDILLKELKATKDIIVGHSFGGKVATLLNPKLLVLLSSAGIALPKPMNIKIKIALFKVLKIFGFSKLRSYFVADDAKKLDFYMYETFKNVVDEDFSEIFASFENKALLFWGKDDTATPLKSAKEIEKLIKNSSLKVYNGDHYFFTKYAKDISKEIEQNFNKG
jgi:pimeloyl-ACP methyl ester carboxylesterase